jgi:hypothetical protein
VAEGAPAAAARAGDRFGAAGRGGVARTVRAGEEQGLQGGRAGRRLAVPSAGADGGGRAGLACRDVYPLPARVDGGRWYVEDRLDGAEGTATGTTWTTKTPRWNASAPR